MSTNLLQINDLYLEYRTDETVVQAINGISLAIQNGKTVGLVGETGAGKTSTALSIMGLVPNPPGKIVNGEIFYGGRDLLKENKKAMRAIRGAEIAMIFQDPMTSLNPVLTVGEQITEAILLHNEISQKDAVIRAMEMLEMVGIQGTRYGEYPWQFSGGMKQRVVIAIALSCSPKLLIADEPTTALDVTIQAQVLALMKRLRDELNTSILLITHDLGVVAETCDEVHTMYAGEIVESGTLEDVFGHTAHPYTRGLFDSLPDPDNKVHRLKAIRGLVPDPSNLPKGCKFSPRCDYAVEECRTRAPEFVETRPGHFVRCLRYEGGGTLL